MRGTIRHLSVALAALTTLAARQPAPPPPGVPAPGTATFAIVLRGARIGSATVSVQPAGTGWLISETAHQSAPVNLQTTKFELTYDAGWQPSRLVVEAVLGGQAVNMTSTFTPTLATNNLSGSSRTGSFSQPISARAIVLPNSFYGAYEALAVRLTTMTIGERVPIYVAPDGEVDATLVNVTARHVATPSAPPSGNSICRWAARWASARRCGSTNAIGWRASTFRDRRCSSPAKISPA
jgi:hypothetical protein